MILLSLVALAAASPLVGPGALGPYGVEAPPWEPEEPPPPLAQPVEGFGIGIVLGLPTGLTAAWRPGGPVWYDAAVAWSFARGSFAVHADALVTLSEIRTEDFPDTAWPLYVGVGPRVRMGAGANAGYGGFELGARVPVGMGVVHDGFPLEGFLELAPGVGLVPDTRFTFDAAIGARFYIPRKASATPATIPA